jgi:hypothetical protein
LNRFSEDLDFTVRNGKGLKNLPVALEKDVFMARIREKEEYWESELKPLVIGKLPRFEVVYKAVNEIL